jgi:hypothetical protein
MVTLSMDSGPWTQLAYDTTTHRYKTDLDTVSTLAISQKVEFSAIAVDSVGLVSDPTFTALTIAPSCMHTLFAPDSVPSVFNDSAALWPGLTLGVKFTPYIDGFVSGVRYYEGVANTSLRTGSLWTADGQLLSTLTFQDAIKAGWQEARFIPPILVRAGATYVVSYHTTSGHYAFVGNYFLSEFVNGHLSTPGPNNGVYTYGPGGLFPQGTYNSANYWVEPVFESPCVETLFPMDAIPGTLAAEDASAVELGVRFTSDVAAVVIGLRFYKSETNIGLHIGNLWTADGELLVSVSFMGETLSGWQTAFFPTPISIAPNTTYVVSYHTEVGRYAFNGNYFGFPVDSGHLHTLPGANGVYKYGQGGFPSYSYNVTNYWVDPIVKIP